MNTVGVDVYPDPSFKIVSEFIKPDCAGARVADAVAVAPEPTRLRVVINP